MDDIKKKIKDRLTHIAIIMDGNGRWAQNKNKHRSFGHKEGALTAKKIIKYCSDIDLKYLTLFAFSRENWLRPKKEVEVLMKIFSTALTEQLQFLIENNIKLHVIGELSTLSSSLSAKLNEIISKTKENTGLNLIIALSYSGQWQIVDSINKILNKGLEKISIEDFEKTINPNFTPAPDILIRTGGENRISNFMLWQLAYTEIFFLNTMWPDFSAEMMSQVITKYLNIERRFGQTSKQVQSI